MHERSDVYMEQPFPVLFSYAGASSVDALRELGVRIRGVEELAAVCTTTHIHTQAHIHIYIRTHT
jgi:hypothetical protein